MSSYQKMQKKAKPNGFLLFAQEFSVSFHLIWNLKFLFCLFQHKHHLSLPFEDLKDIVSIHWNELTEDQKQMYKTKAKPSSISLPSFNPNNQALIDSERRQNRHEIMMDEVRILVQNAFDMGSKFHSIF